jgi:hypothetical protein
MASAGGALRAHGVGVGRRRAIFCAHSRALGSHAVAVLRELADACGGGSPAKSSTAGAQPGGRLGRTRRRLRCADGAPLVSGVRRGCLVISSGSGVVAALVRAGSRGGRLRPRLSSTADRQLLDGTGKCAGARGRFAGIRRRGLCAVRLVRRSLRRPREPCAALRRLQRGHRRRSDLFPGQPRRQQHGLRPAPPVREGLCRPQHQSVSLWRVRGRLRARRALHDGAMRVSPRNPRLRRHLPTMLQRCRLPDGEDVLGRGMRAGLQRTAGRVHGSLRRSADGAQALRPLRQ